MHARTLCSLLLLPFCAGAQVPDSTMRTDSSLYFRLRYRELRSHYDSLMQSTTAYREVVAGMARHPRRGGSSGSDYSALIVFTGVLDADVSAFNGALARAGFGPVAALAPQFGVGFGGRQGALLIDLYVAAGGATRSERDGRTLTASLANVMHLELGLDLLPARAVSIYPYGGLSYRSARLGFESPEEVNPAATGLPDLVVNRKVDVSSRRLGYSAGLGLDVQLGGRRVGGGRRILFLKGGVNRPVWKDRYRYKGVDVGPGPDWGDWQLSAGVKFVRWD